MRRALATVTAAIALLLLSASASAEPWTQRTFILSAGPRDGIRTNHGVDVRGLGGGVAASFTAPFPVSFQLELDCFAGSRGSSLCQVGWGPGYDLGLGPIVLRPFTRAGLAVLTRPFNGLFLAGGASILYGIKSFAVSLDGRYELISIRQSTEAVVISLNVGFALALPRRDTPGAL